MTKGPPKPLLPGKFVMQLECGKDHCLALDGNEILFHLAQSLTFAHPRDIDSGNCYSWGRENGLCQLGSDGPAWRTPKVIKSLAKRRVSRIFAGYAFSFCALQNGELLSFGANSKGQLLHPFCTAIMAPKEVSQLKVD